MQSGADIDIVSGRPSEQEAAIKEAEKNARDEKILKDRAEYYGLTGSIEGRKLIALIQSNLNMRIDALIAQDPQAQCLVRLLADMGIKENEGAKAAARLVAIKIRKE